MQLNGCNCSNRKGSVETSIHTPFCVLLNRILLFQFLDGSVFQASLDKVFGHFGKIRAFSYYDPIILGSEFFLNENPVRSEKLLLFQ